MDASKQITALPAAEDEDDADIDEHGGEPGHDNQHGDDSFEESDNESEVSSIVSDLSLVEVESEWDEILESDGHARRVQCPGDMIFVGKWLIIEYQ
ncbi:hypothetical protein PsorP6_009460 [Peronosclerospora sorghi]|uniref:Uncharacterized protein n=1 Tax=Peronosclerospora sorghi TaxID=230839 RepID=A0ACC0W2A3_9STRA|nr:hypothetical protein PsorP6_009460 [Peronosclerospora sorghi]